MVSCVFFSTLWRLYWNVWMYMCMCKPVDVRHRSWLKWRVLTSTTATVTFLKYLMVSSENLRNKARMTFRIAWWKRFPVFEAVLEWVPSMKSSGFRLKSVLLMTLPLTTWEILESSVRSPGDGLRKPTLTTVANQNTKGAVHLKPFWRDVLSLNVSRVTSDSKGEKLPSQTRQASYISS